MHRKPKAPSLESSNGRNKNFLEWGSLEVQEAGHGHENPLPNPRLIPRFWGTFTPDQHENGELLTRSQNEVGNFFTRTKNELGNFFQANGELPE